MSVNHNSKEPLSHGGLSMNNDPEMVSNPLFAGNALGVNLHGVPIRATKVSRRRVPSIWSHVGIRGILLCLVPIGFGMCHIYIVYEKTNKFTTSMARSWPFVGLASVSFALPIYDFIRWKSYLTFEDLSIISSTDGQTRDDMRAIDRTRGINIHRLFRTFREFFNTNGKYFLWKISCQEAIKDIFQMYNLATIYSCTLPVGVVFSICALLVVYNVFLLHHHWFQSHTAETRFYRVHAHFVLNSICYAVPILFLWFNFRIPMSSLDLLIFTGWPTLSSLIDISNLFQGLIESNHVEFRLRSQKSAASARHRRRSSIFALPEVARLANVQVENFPLKVKYAVSILSGAAGIFFFVVGVFQITMTAPPCHKIMNACLVPVPFCHSMLEARCNCVVLKIAPHNMTNLPGEFEHMKALRSVEINNGPLERLPNYMFQFQSLSLLRLKNNTLTQIEPIVGLKKLKTLDITMNQLRILPDGIGPGLPELTRLYADSNSIEFIPYQLYGSQLRYLFLRHNNLIKLEKLGPKFWEVIEVLDIGFNKLTMLPTLDVPPDSLSAIDIPNNNITAFPTWLGNAPRLKWVDARRNAISTLPGDFKSLRKLFVAGNPLCTNVWLSGKGASPAVIAAAARHGSGCTKQCAPTCIDEWRGNGECYQGCNTKTCEYDNGDCPLY